MHNRFLLRTAIVLVLAAVAYSASPAQEASTAGNVGLSASLQGSQFDILVPIWISNRFVIAPAVGLLWSEDGGTDIRLAVAPRYFFYKEKFAPYLGARIGALIASPESGSSSTDLLFGLALGGEYFLDPHFSLGAEAQLNLSVSGDNSARFGNPGKKNLNTGAAALATVYF